MILARIAEGGRDGVWLQIHLRGPEFKHKSTNDALGIDSYKEPGWVESVLKGLDGAKVTGIAGKHPKSRTRDEKKLWAEYFSDSSQWWDNRGRKIHPRGPDFKHRSTNKALWIDGCTTPAWVEGQLEAGGAHLLESATSTVMTDFVHGPRERVYTSRDVRTLCKAGQLKVAVHILNQGGIFADTDTYVCLLQECIKMKWSTEGKQVHAHIIRSGFKPNIFLLNTLLDMHAKCGSIKDARLIFDKMCERDMYTWNIMVAGYAKHGYGREALETYGQMIQVGMTPNKFTFVSVVKACGSLAALEKGKEVHADIMQAVIGPDIILETALVTMYAKCGNINYARQVFDNMARRNVVSWSAMMAGYAQHGCDIDALESYKQMRQQGVTPDQVIFVCLLKACASLAALETGKEVHADIMRAGIVPNVILDTALVDMYAKCGSINDARRVFDNMAQRDVVSWNAMIAGYAQHGCGREALQTYEQMIREGLIPHHVTFVSVVNACASVAALEKGKEVHADILKAGIVPNVILDTALINMYAKCGSINDASRVFGNMAQRDVVSWSVMIAGYALHGCGMQAWQTYEQMIAEGETPDQVTFVAVLNACASLAALEKGKEVHMDIMKAGIVPDIVLENTLIDMYGKCGSIDDARRLFDNMAQHDVVSWNVMMAGYAQHGFGRDALQTYEQMTREGVMPDQVTFVCVLNVCASLAASEKGKEVHADLLKSRIVRNIVLETALVAMYAKCGNIEDAYQVFDNMPERNVVSWNAMMAGFAQHGCGRKALDLFKQMQQEGLKPNGVTFLCVLNACSHVGLVDEGRHYWDSLSRDHDLSPSGEHFACMVDLLGRAGHLDEAEDLVKRMPTKPDAVVWRALLGACRIHGNVEVAERAAKYMRKWDQQDAVTYSRVTKLSPL